MRLGASSDHLEQARYAGEDTLVYGRRNHEHRLGAEHVRDRVVLVGPGKVVHTYVGPRRGGGYACRHSARELPCAVPHAVVEDCYAILPIVGGHEVEVRKADFRFEVVDEFLGVCAKTVSMRAVLPSRTT